LKLNKAFFSPKGSCQIQKHSYKKRGLQSSEPSRYLALPQRDFLKNILFFKKFDKQVRNKCLFAMPMITIVTSAPYDRVPVDFCSLLTDLLAEMLQKPRERVVVHLMTDQLVRLGTEEEETLLATLSSIGKIGADFNQDHLDKLCAFFQKHLNITPLFVSSTWLPSMSHGMDSCVTNDSALLGLDLTFSSSISVLSTIKTLLILPDFICQQSPVCFAKFNALSIIQLPKMPIFTFSTNVPSENISVDFLKSTSKLIAGMLGKPESYVAVHINGGQKITFGGTDGPAGFGQLLSLGGVGGEKNRSHSAKLFKHLTDGLGIPGNRMYINFVDMRGSDVGREAKFGSYLLVLYGGRFRKLFKKLVKEKVASAYRFSFHPFGGETAAGNCGTATEGLKFSVNNLAVFVHFYLQLHHVAASWRPNDSGADIWIFLVQRTDVPGIVVMVDNLSKTLMLLLFALHYCLRSCGRPPLKAKCFELLQSVEQTVDLPSLTVVKTNCECVNRIQYTACTYCLISSTVHMRSYPPGRRLVGAVVLAMVASAFYVFLPVSFPEIFGTKAQRLASHPANDRRTSTDEAL
ncbi:hypothetical protein M513_13891, partial [Trichuris suis]